MTIASEITKLNANLTNSYTAVSDKGGTIPQSQNFDNLANAISSIPSGSGISIPREAKNGVYQMPTESFTFSLPNDITNVGNYSLAYAFNGCKGLTSVDLSSLTTVSGTNSLSYAFRNCTGLTNVYFRSLKTSSFGSYKNQFKNMMSSTGTSKTHTLHFPSNLQSTISGLDGYPLFGGTSEYVVLSFDLPATE